MNDSGKGMDGNRDKGYTWNGVKEGICRTLDFGGYISFVLQRA